MNFLFGSENKDRRTSHDDKVNELTHEQTEERQAKREEEIGKERANKTARVKWGRGNERQMANNVNAREMGL